MLLLQMQLPSRNAMPVLKSPPNQGYRSRRTLLENVTALRVAAHVEQFLGRGLIRHPPSRGGGRRAYHSRLGASLLRLEEDGFLPSADRARLVRARKL